MPALLFIRVIDIPLSTKRRNVLPDGASPVRAMVLGMYARVNRVGTSRVTVRSPGLTRLLVAAARKAAPDFSFTSIQVNRD